MPRKWSVYLIYKLAKQNQKKKATSNLTEITEPIELQSELKQYLQKIT